MITLRNNATGEIVKCSYTRIDSAGRVYYRNADNGGKQPTDKFLSARGLSLTGEHAEINGVTSWYLAIGSGWSINDAKPARAPKKDGTPAPKPAPKKEQPEPAPVPAQPVTERHEIAINGANVGAVDGLTCRQFDEILTYCAARVPAYLYGAAGCGKSHTAEQIATALGLPFYAQMQLVNKYDVIGFVDAGGVYQSTPFYHAFKSGGVILFDEYDRGDASAIITLNGALANGYVTFPNGERVTRHENFVFIAAGNTNGLGATTEYNTASQLDASSTDRPAFVEMDYDPRLENEFSKNDPTIAEFCRDIRRAVDVCAVSGMIVSYRAIINMNKFAGGNLTAEKLINAFILKGRDRDTAAVLFGALQDKNNKWAKALKNIAVGK